MKKKVMIVDDDEEICEELSEILKGEGYAVETYYDGLKASQAIARAGSGMVLLDLKLPNFSGFQILDMIRKKKIPVKVLILTGRPLLKKREALSQVSSQTKEEEKILKLADGIINKPFDIKVLLQKIQELLK